MTEWLGKGFLLAICVYAITAVFVPGLRMRRKGTTISLDATESAIVALVLEVFVTGLVVLPLLPEAMGLPVSAAALAAGGALILFGRRLDKKERGPRQTPLGQ